MKYSIKSRIWIEVDGAILLGQGRAELLETIWQTGSLTKAAKTMGMSYKKAWRLLDAMNKAGASAVVETSVGGKDGGGAILTDYGKQILEAFNAVKNNSLQFLDSQLDKLPS